MVADEEEPSYVHHLLKRVEELGSIPAAQRNEELTDTQLELAAQQLARYSSSGSLTAIKELSDNIVDQWPRTSPLAEEILRWTQAISCTTKNPHPERNQQNDPNGTANPDQWTYPANNLDHATEKWASARDKTTETVEDEPALFENRYLAATAIIGFINVNATVAALDLKELLRVGALNHILEGDAAAPRPIQLSSRPTSQRKTPTPPTLQDALETLYSQRPQQQGDPTNWPMGTKQDVTCRLINATLEQALAELADSDTHEFFNALIVGTEQMERAAIFFADSRIHETLVPVADICKFRDCHGYLTGIMPGLPLTEPIPQTVLKRGLWGKRLFATLVKVEGKYMWRTLSVEQNEVGQWLFEEYGTRLTWEDTEQYRQYYPQDRLTAQCVEKYARIHLIRPWHAGYYRGPIYHLRAPRIVADTGT